MPYDESTPAISTASAPASVGHHSPLLDRPRDGRAVTAILAFALGSTA